MPNFVYSNGDLAEHKLLIVVYVSYYVMIMSEDEVIVVFKSYDFSV